MVHSEWASPSAFGSGDPSCPIWSVSPCPMSCLICGHPQGQCWAAVGPKPCVFSLWLGPNGCLGSWLSPVQCHVAHQQTAGSRNRAPQGSPSHCVCCSGISFSSKCWQVPVGPVQRSGEPHPAQAFPTWKKKTPPPKNVAPCLGVQYAYEVDLLQCWT